jgi:hypothetical protein
MSDEIEAWRTRALGIVQDELRALLELHQNPLSSPGVVDVAGRLVGRLLPPPPAFTRQRYDAELAKLYDRLNQGVVVAQDPGALMLGVLVQRAELAGLIEYPAPGAAHHSGVECAVRQNHQIIQGQWRPSGGASLAEAQAGECLAEGETAQPEAGPQQGPRQVVCVLQEVVEDWYEMTMDERWSAMMGVEGRHDVLRAEQHLRPLEPYYSLVYKGEEPGSAVVRVQQLCEVAAPGGMMVALTSEGRRAAVPVSWMEERVQGVPDGDPGVRGTPLYSADDGRYLGHVKHVKVVGDPPEGDGRTFTAPPWPGDRHAS